MCVCVNEQRGEQGIAGMPGLPGTPVSIILNTSRWSCMVKLGSRTDCMFLQLTASVISELDGLLLTKRVQFNPNVKFYFNFFGFVSGETRHWWEERPVWKGCEKCKLHLWQSYSIFYVSFPMNFKKFKLFLLTGRKWVQRRGWKKGTSYFKVTILVLFYCFGKVLIFL